MREQWTGLIQYVIMVCSTEWADVNSKDYAKLSIVVQGPLHEDVSLNHRRVSSAQLIRGMQARFPGAQVIVSTWTSEDVPALPSGDVVTSNDPGPYKFHHPDCGKLSNFNYNRMLLSTQAGLSRVSREFVLKVRSDTLVHGDGFWEIFRAHAKLKPARGLFRSPIVVSSIYSRDPLKSHRLFHPSDMIQFGRSEDMLKLWAAQPIEPAQWAELRPAIEAGCDLLAPEQILTLDLLRRTDWLGAQISDLSAYRMVRLSEELLATCFIVAGPEHLQISNADRFTEFSDPHTCYSYETWKALQASVGGFVVRRMRALRFLFNSKLRMSGFAVRVGRALSPARR